MIHLLQVTIPTNFPEIEMKKTLLIIATLVVVQITLGCCGGSDEVDENKRQYNGYIHVDDDDQLFVQGGIFSYVPVNNFHLVHSNKSTP